MNVTNSLHADVTVGALTELMNNRCRYGPVRLAETWLNWLKNTVLAELL